MPANRPGTAGLATRFPQGVGCGRPSHSAVTMVLRNNATGSTPMPRADHHHLAEQVVRGLPSAELVVPASLICYSD